jgi:hypothetical protein
MEISINALLSMEKSLKQRVGHLREMAQASATRTIFHDKSETKEPIYDLKKIDHKITKIIQKLFFIDQTIKESNAVTKINIELDYEDLTSELE